MPEMMKRRPRQGAPSADLSKAGTKDFPCVAPKPEGVKFRFSARACRCGSDVCIVGAELAVNCVDCGGRRGHLTERTAAFISQVIAQFGAPLNPIILRREAGR